MPLEPIIFYEGERFIVECAIRSNGTSESETFLDNLSKPLRAKIIKIIKRYADVGWVRNSEQFKKVESDIWEFKEFQRRILMYHCARGRIALTHGFIKKGDRIPKTQTDRAKQIMLEYNQVRKDFRNV
jgi:phage-related protein